MHRSTNQGSPSLTAQRSLSGARLLTTFVVLIALSVSGGANAGESGADYVEYLSGVAGPGQAGGVNWSAGVVFAHGEGFVPEKYRGQARGLAMARRAATVDAYRNLLEISQGVRIDSRTVVRDLVVEDDAVVAALSGVIRGATIAVVGEYEESVRVRAEVRIDGDFAGVVLPRVNTSDTPVSFTPRLRRWLPRLVEEARAAPSPLPPVPCADAAGSEPSGLIIDARHLAGLSPAITPRLWLASGPPAYPSDIARPDLQAVRVATYDIDESVACARARVRDNPAVIEASAVHKTLKSDLVIEDAAWAKVSGHASIFSAAKVLILVRARP